MIRALVWLPHSYNGRGPAESCVRIVEQFAAAGIAPTVFTLRNRKPLPASVNSVEGAGLVDRLLPLSRMAARSMKRLERRFARAIDRAEPGTIAWFWPVVPRHLVERARARGLVTVREFINSPVCHARPLLDAAYAAAGLPPGHGIGDDAVAAVIAELPLHDFIFASNAEVDQALIDQGVPRERILSGSFGWTAARFAGDTVARPKDGTFRMAYVGTLNVRKGVPVLLEAWDRAGIDGELWLAGGIEPAIAPLVQAQLARDKGLRHFGFVEDVAAFYRACDVFVFPTHEEGGPQVTYEAAGCGLPVITTPMGAARLVRDGENGLLVPPGDADALAAALRRLADDPALRESMGAQAQADAARFEYALVGRQRAEMLLAAIETR